MSELAPEKLSATPERALDYLFALLEDGLRGPGVNVWRHHNELFALAKAENWAERYCEWTTFVELFDEAIIGAWKHRIDYLFRKLREDNAPFIVDTYRGQLEEEVEHLSWLGQSLSELGLSQTEVNGVIEMAWQRSGYGAWAELKKDVANNAGGFDPDNMLIAQSIGELRWAIRIGARFDELSPEDAALLQRWRDSGAI